MKSAGSRASNVAGVSGGREQQWYCVACPVRHSSFCAALLGEYRNGSGVRFGALTPAIEHVPARQIFYHGGQQTDKIFAICTGWAIVFERLRDGRRHIVHFLISGDFCGALSVFRDSGRYSFQAITDLRVGIYKRPDVRARIVGQPPAFTGWMEQSMSFYRQAATSALALGRLTATERIALLITQLRDRLAARSLVNDESFAFPLRHTHVADATGLTTVHVSRVLGSLRKARLIEIEAGQLTITDLAKLRRITATGA